MMRRYLVPTVLMLLSASATLAQQPLMYAGKGANYAALCSQPTVIRELGLSVKQVAGMRALQDGFALANFNGGNTDVRIQRARLGDELHEKAKKILSKSQLRRARQLKIQFDIKRGFLDAALREMGHEQLDEEVRRKLRDELYAARGMVEHKLETIKFELAKDSLRQIAKPKEIERLMGKPYPFVRVDERRLVVPQNAAPF